jgi:uncharacterized protein (TIGR03032 family)
MDPRSQWHVRAFSDNLPVMRYRATAPFLNILSTIGSTLAISAYTSSRLVLISATDGIATIRSHEIARPMGIAVTRDAERTRLALSCHTVTLIFAECPRLIGEFDQPDRKCGALFLPRAVHFTGNIDGHDADWAGETLLVANTRFSCVARVGDVHGFEPVWQPPFVTSLQPEDRCHLNGIACAGGAFAFATMFSGTNRAGGWRDAPLDTGLLMSRDGTIVIGGLIAPHSPRVIDSALYVAESGFGRVLRLDPVGAPRVLATLPGFTRGIGHHGDILFVGLSKLRPGRRLRLPIEDNPEPLMCGVLAIDRHSGQQLGWIAFDDFEEVFDVKVLPGMRDVVIEPPNGDASSRAIDMPGRAFWTEPDATESAG